MKIKNVEKLTNEKQNTVYGKCSCYYLYYFLITYFGSSTLNAGGAEALGGAIATALVTPRIILFLIGAIFGRVGFIAKKSRAALVTAILYSMFGIPILVSGFVGYSKQKKLNLQNN